jgi:hypothetical protein
VENNLAKLAALLSLLLLTSRLSSAEDRTYTYKGRVIHYTFTAFKPPLSMRPDPKHMNPDSPANCAILFVSRLKAGDVQGAAELSTTPEHVLDLYAKYKARVGDQTYAEQMSKIFGDDLHYIYDLVIGSEHALLPDKMPGLAHYVKERNGRFFIEFPQIGRESKEVDDLSVLINENEAGRLKFE